MTRVASDISAWKRLNILINMDKKALTDRTRGRQIITARKSSTLIIIVETVSSALTRNFGDV